MGKHVKSEDLIGKKFNKFTINNVIESKGEKGRLMDCTCDCGNRIITTLAIVKTSTTFCECQKRDKQKKHIGEKYNMLTIVDIDSLDTKNVMVKCDCGNSKSVSLNQLKKEIIKSCGCLVKTKNVTGEKYNMLTITGIAPSKREPSGKLIKRVYTVCECGNTNESSYKNLKRGLIQSCGCLNESLKRKVETGQRFNLWTVIKEIDPIIYKDNKRRKILCRCVCGKEKKVFLDTLFNNQSKSCGCQGREKKIKEEMVKIIPQDTESERWKQSVNYPDYYISTLGRLFNYQYQIYARSKRVHERSGKGSIYILEEMYRTFIGEYDGSVYSIHLIGEEIKLENIALKETKTERSRKLRNVYTAMTQRCKNKNHPDYVNYGGRGIKIEESLNTFDKFFNWAIDNGYEEGLQIDREDNNGNYSTINCRWVSKAENIRNTRRNVINWELVDKIRYGEYKNMPYKEIAKILKCSKTTIRDVKEFKTWNR